MHGLYIVYGFHISNNSTNAQDIKGDFQWAFILKSKLHSENLEYEHAGVHCLPDYDTL